MARNVTLGQLRADIADQGDQYIATSARTTPTLVNRLINQSIQRFREKVSAEGITRFLEPVSGNLTAGLTAPYSFGVLDLGPVATMLVRTYGLDVTVDSEVRALKHVPFTDHTDYGTTTGIPCAWAHYQTTKIAILPAPASTYAYTAWYLKALADLVADSDTFDGLAGHEDFVTWDVLSRLIVRDQFPAQYQLAVNERQGIWDDIVRQARRTSLAGGAIVGRDSLGRGMHTRRRSLPWPT